MNDNIKTVLSVLFNCNIIVLYIISLIPCSYILFHPLEWSFEPRNGSLNTIRQESSAITWLNSYLFQEELTLCSSINVPALTAELFSQPQVRRILIIAGTSFFSFQIFFCCPPKSVYARLSSYAIMCILLLFTDYAVFSFLLCVQNILFMFLYFTFPIFNRQYSHWHRVRFLISSSLICNLQRLHSFVNLRILFVSWDTSKLSSILLISINLHVKRLIGFVKPFARVSNIYYPILSSIIPSIFLFIIIHIGKYS